MAFERILIFQTAFLGDLILTSPLIKSVKKSFEDAEVFLVVRKGLKGVFEGSKFLKEIIEFDKKSNLNLIKRLKELSFDLVLSPHRSHRTALILFFSGIKKRIGFDRGGFSFLYTDRVKYVRKRGVHEVDRNLSLLSPLEDFGLKIDNTPFLPITEEELSAVKKTFSLNSPYVVLAPGSVWKTKAWIPEYYGAVGTYFKRLGFEVVIVGSRSDKDYCDETFNSMGGKAVNLCGKTTVREFLTLLKGAKLVISNDSAPVHGAVAFNVPVVEIYGSTVPEFGFYPYRNGVYVEPPLPLKCRPCGIHGRRNCPEGHFRCMTSITPDLVIKASEKLLSL